MPFASTRHGTSTQQFSGRERIRPRFGTLPFILMGPSVSTASIMYEPYSWVRSVGRGSWPFGVSSRRLRQWRRYPPVRPKSNQWSSSFSKRGTSSSSTIRAFLRKYGAYSLAWQLDAHGLLSTYLLSFNGVLDLRVKVFFAAAELEEESLVIDPCAKEVDLLVGNPDPRGEHLARPLYAVAESHVRASCAEIHRPAVGRHRVDVVKQQGARGQLVHLVAEVDQHRDGAQGAEDPARTERIADTLFHPILLRDLDVQGVGFEAALLKCRHHVVSATYGLPTIGGSLYLCG